MFLYVNLPDCESLDVLFLRRRNKYAPISKQTKAPIRRLKDVMIIRSVGEISAGGACDIIWPKTDNQIENYGTVRISHVLWKWIDR